MIDVFCQNLKLQTVALTHRTVTQCINTQFTFIVSSFYSSFLTR